MFIWVRELPDNRYFREVEKWPEKVRRFLLRNSRTSHGQS